MHHNCYSRIQERNISKSGVTGLSIFFPFSFSSFSPRSVPRKTWTATKGDWNGAMNCEIHESQPGRARERGKEKRPDHVMVVQLLSIFVQVQGLSSFSLPFLPLEAAAAAAAPHPFHAVFSPQAVSPHSAACVPNVQRWTNLGPNNNFFSDRHGQDCGPKAKFTAIPPPPLQP